MERLLIRVPLLLVEWLNPVGSGATFLLYHKKNRRTLYLSQYGSMGFIGGLIANTAHGRSVVA